MRTMETPNRDTGLSWMSEAFTDHRCNAHWPGMHKCQRVAGHTGPHIARNENGEEVCRWSNVPSQQEVTDALHAMMPDKTWILTSTTQYNEPAIYSAAAMPGVDNEAGVQLFQGNSWEAVILAADAALENWDQTPTKE